ncbi:MLO-like protein 4 isoform X2 [Cucumis sativus]|uniref:MLO-like protein 4 isoform X2 n=1 Tax=Cucumis sativus TaxID=3659 RepID=UPI0012F479DD|nr:MLO-like protein 4 isoform X2 [Cucumis sativus]
MELQGGRSLAETPTYSVASVVTVMVFVCLVVERAIYRFGKWLKKTKRKALFASLEKIKEELMLLGLISLMLAQCARWISEICVNSSLFTSRFYICSEEDYATNEHILLESSLLSHNEIVIPQRELSALPHQCGEGREPFVSYEGLEQLHRFLFVLGITHVLYSCLAVGLAMSKIYSWRKWESQVKLAAEDNLPAKRNKVMRRQTTFVFHHTSHPWSRSRILIWMKHKLPISYDFHKYMVRSMEDEFHGILGISWPLWGYAILCIFVNIHGLNIYFWLSFIPAALVMLVGTKLQHVVSSLALEVLEQRGGIQIKPRDDLFWFGKPVILLRLIQFIIFQNAFEMATFIWSLWGFKERSCFMKNDFMIITRLTSGVLVQFWCSYSTVPLNIIVTQMGSKCKKALVAESVRESLHSWCKRVKERSKRDSAHSITTRSVCSLESMVDERDEITIASGTLSRSSSFETSNQVTVQSTAQLEAIIESSSLRRHEELPPTMADFLSQSARVSHANGLENNAESGEDSKVESLFDLFKRT